VVYEVLSGWWKLTPVAIFAKVLTCGESDVTGACPPTVAGDTVLTGANTDESCVGNGLTVLIGVAKDGKNPGEDADALRLPPAEYPYEAPTGAWILPPTVAAGTVLTGALKLPPTINGDTVLTGSCVGSGLTVLIGDATDGKSPEEDADALRLPPATYVVTGALKLPPTVTFVVLTGANSRITIGGDIAGKGALKLPPARRVTELNGDVTGAGKNPGAPADRSGVGKEAVKLPPMFNVTELDGATYDAIGNGAFKLPPTVNGIEGPGEHERLPPAT